MLKKILQKIGVFLGILVMVASYPGVALAASCGGNFLGLRPWYYGLTDEKCEIKVPSGDEEKIAVFVWVIILNIFSSILSLSGLIAAGFIIYGGYLYIRWGEEPDKVSKAKKTITSAVTGLVIVLLAAVISNTVVDVISGALK